MYCKALREFHNYILHSKYHSFSTSDAYFRLFMSTYILKGKLCPREHLIFSGFTPLNINLSLSSSCPQIRPKSAVPGRCAAERRERNDYSIFCTKETGNDKRNKGEEEMKD